MYGEAHVIRYGGMNHGGTAGRYLRCCPPRMNIARRIQSHGGDGSRLVSPGGRWELQGGGCKFVGARGVKEVTASARLVCIYAAGFSSLTAEEGSGGIE